MIPMREQHNKQQKLEEKFTRIGSENRIESKEYQTDLGWHAMYQPWLITMHTFITSGIARTRDKWWSRLKKIEEQGEAGWRQINKQEHPTEAILEKV